MLKIKIILLAVASSVLVLLHSQSESNTNTASRHATIDSLYRFKTYAIDNAYFNGTHDKAFWQGHFYSPKPPVLSTIGAGPYALYATVTGNTFQKDHKKAVRFTSLILGLVPHLLLLFYFYRFLTLLNLSPRSLLWGFSSISIGYLGWGFASGVNNHTPTAAALLGSLYHAYRLRKGFSDRRRDWILSGFLAALAATFDHPSLFFSMGIFFYLFTHHAKKTLAYFMVGAMVPLAAHFTITYLSTGLFMPLQWQKGVFHYPGSYWHTPRGFDDLWESPRIYLFHMLLGHHGFFSMSPVVLLGTGAMIRSVMKRDRNAPEAFLVLVSFVCMVIFYVVYTHSYGGCTVGFRWLIPAMPPFILFSALWLDIHRKTGALILYVFFFGVGFVNAFDALQDPWQCVSAWNRLLIRLGIAQEIEL